MPTTTLLRLSVADLLTRPGASRAVALHADVPDLELGGTRVPAGASVAIDLLLERVPEGIVVRGTVRAPWESQCSRCLVPVQGDVEVHVDELFEPDPVEGETYRLEHDAIDLEPVVRDHLLPELPTSPHCRDDCRGLCPYCGADRNEVECGCAPDDPDPRWAALRSLEL